MHRNFTYLFAKIHENFQSFNMLFSIGQGCWIACNLTCYNHDNCIISMYSVYLYMFLAFQLLKFIWERKMVMRSRPLYSLGNSLFSDIFINYLFCCDCHDHGDRAVSMQPWIRLTLYNPNQCKFLNYVTHFLVVIFHQKALAILHSWVAH